MDTSSRLLRTAKAAQYCGFTKSTLEKWRCYNLGGPPFVRLGVAVYYDTKDIDDWLAALPRYHSTREADDSDNEVVKSQLRPR